MNGQTLKSGGVEFLKFVKSGVRYAIDRFRYGSTAPKPYELIYIDPADIRYCTLPSLMSQFNITPYGTYVVGGDWDQRPEWTKKWYTRSFATPVIAPFENHVLFISMENHFIHGVPWEDTEWYQWIAANPETVGQYRTTEVMDERLKEVDRLFEYIQNDGYKTQRELIQDDSVPLQTTQFPCPRHYEIDVNIGRDGEPFFNYNGRHRLAITKILNLNEIPVRVFVRHTEWQQYRSQAGRLETKHTHPDIKNIDI